MASDTARGTKTKLSRAATALAAVMAVNIILIILLTPLGFETRQIPELKPLGYVAIATIFVGLAMDLASVALLFKRTKIKLASGMAIVSSVLFFLIIIVDRTGSFFSVPIPPAISTLEYLLIVALVVTLPLALKVFDESGSA
jgi:Na+-transporting methylmalonyl-CoA/oxaloacetate decarboxylase gamma subunit